MIEIRLSKDKEYDKKSRQSNECKLYDKAYVFLKYHNLLKYYNLGRRGLISGL